MAASLYSNLASLAHAPHIRGYQSYSINVQSDTQKNVAFCNGSPALPTCPMLPVPQNAQNFQLLQSHSAFQSHTCSTLPLQGVLQISLKLFQMIFQIQQTFS